MKNELFPLFLFLQEQLKLLVPADMPLEISDLKAKIRDPGN
jgi:hypothetical protein